MSQAVNPNEIEASLQPIREILTVLENVPKARKQFTDDLNKKIGQVDTAIQNLGTILTDIKSMKGELAGASKKMKSEAIQGAADLQEKVNAAKKEAEGKCKASIDAVAAELQNYKQDLTVTANDLNTGTLKLKIDDLETNIKNILDEIKKPSNGPGDGLSKFKSAVRNVKDINLKKTGYPVVNPPGLRPGWKAARESDGREYYYKVDAQNKAMGNVDRTYTMPRGGGRKRTRKRRRGGFRYDLGLQEKKTSRTLRSVKSLRSKTRRTKTRTGRDASRGRRRKKTKKRRRRRR
jgi:hypothetical protein